MELFQIGQRKNNLEQQLQSMDIIKEEKYLLKHNEAEKEDQKYWAMKKQTYEFEAQFATL